MFVFTSCSVSLVVCHFVFSSSTHSIQPARSKHPHLLVEIMSPLHTQPMQASSLTWLPPYHRLLSHNNSNNNSNNRVGVASVCVCVAMNILKLYVIHVLVSLYMLVCSSSLPCHIGAMQHPSYFAYPHNNMAMYSLYAQMQAQAAQFQLGHKPGVTTTFATSYQPNPQQFTGLTGYDDGSAPDYKPFPGGASLGKSTNGEWVWFLLWFVLIWFLCTAPSTSTATDFQGFKVHETCSMCSIIYISVPLIRKLLWFKNFMCMGSGVKSDWVIKEAVSNLCFTAYLKL